MERLGTGRRSLHSKKSQLHIDQASELHQTDPYLVPSDLLAQQAWVKGRVLMDSSFASGFLPPFLLGTPSAKQVS